MYVYVCIFPPKTHYNYSSMGAYIENATALQVNSIVKYRNNKI